MSNSQNIFYQVTELANTLSVFLQAYVLLTNSDNNTLNITGKLVRLFPEIIGILSDFMGEVPV